MITNLRKSIETAVEETLSSQKTLVDVTWDVQIGLQQMTQDQPPIPMCNVMLMTPSPILNEGPVSLGGAFVAFTPTDSIGGMILKLVDALAEQRSTHLQKASEPPGSPSEPLTVASKTISPSGLIVPSR